MSEMKMSITVLAELEEWDNTTDAIVWLIEQRYFNTRLPKLRLETMPEYTRGGFENLGKQSADLEGYNKLLALKIRLNFIAEYIDDIEEKEEETGETYTVEGYKITVSDITAQTRKIAEYTIKGTDRKEFSIVEEKTT